MVSEEIKNKIKFLFSEKKYEQVIEITEKFTLSDERPSGLINLLGIAYYSKKNPTSDDFQKSLNCFEAAYKKEKNTIHGLNGIKNLVIVGIKTSNISKEFRKNLLNAKNFYLESESYFNNNNEFLQTGIHLFSYLIDKKKIKEIINIILEKKDSSKDLIGQAIFLINHYFDWKQAQIYEIVNKNKKFFKKLNVKEVYKLKNLNEEKINIGFLSCDLLKNHSITYFLKDTIKYIDRSKFKLFIFSLNKKIENDSSQTEVRKLADQWFDLQDCTNQQVIDTIQDKKIQILFDMIGYTNSKRLEIFNSRVAPVQISWLAYCNTTGMDFIDFLFADKNLIYEDEYNLYSEKVINLPNIWNVHSGFNYERKFNQLPALKGKKFTFGSFNNFMKISEETIETWSEILKRIPNSNLILKSSNFCDENILIKKFKSYGVDDKIIIYNKIDFLNHKDHLNLYKKIDLCLDTFPYNGVTTTFEALWMNVPVLVLKGNNFLSRCGESIIKNSNNHFLIANTLEEYITKSVILSKDLNKLEIMRKDLFNNIPSSLLFDIKKFSKNFNETLLRIYNQYN